MMRCNSRTFGLLNVALVLLAVMQPVVSAAGMSLGAALQQARAALQSRNPQQAVRILEPVQKLARTPGERALLYYYYGLAQWRSGSRHAAMESLQTALRQRAMGREQEARLRYTLARVLTGLDRRDEAIAMLESALCCLRADTAEARLLIADLYSREHKYGKALMHLEGLARQFEHLRQRQQVFALTATAYIERGQLRLAVPPLKTLLSYAPERRQYWLTLAKAYLGLGEISRAMAVLDNARLNGSLKDADDIYLLASVYQNQGESLKAVALLEGALAEGGIEPSKDNIRLLSQAWYAAGDWGRVRDQLEQHFALATPVDPELVRHLVGVQLLAGDRCEALASLRWLLEHAPDGLGAVWFQTGLTQYQLGNIEQAREAFTEALEFPEVEDRARLALDRLGSSGQALPEPQPFAP